MSWNYRVFNLKGTDEEWYEIREVYYSESGRPSRYSISPGNAGGNTLEELVEDLQRMLDATELPAMTIEDFWKREVQNHKG
jgi:hypothetical protein